MMRANRSRVYRQTTVLGDVQREAEAETEHAEVPRKRQAKVAAKVTDTPHGVDRIRAVFKKWQDDAYDRERDRRLMDGGGGW